MGPEVRFRPLLYCTLCASYSKVKYILPIWRYTLSDNSAPQPDAPSLGLVDIQNALKVIDYACDQGAFKGWSTIEQVQLVRTKIAAFVAYATENSDDAANGGEATA